MQIFEYYKFLIFLFLVNLLTFCNAKKKITIFQNLIIGNALINESKCNAKQSQIQKSKVFQTGFESIDDFKPSYIVPQNYQSSATHHISSEIKFTGSYSHKGLIYAKGPSCNFPTNCNHRGYPTLQLHKMSTGSFRTPIYFEFYVNLDMSLKTNDWFSFATFSVDESDSWSRVILINLSDSGFVHAMHVPNQGEGVRTFQTTNLLFPQKEWVKISACIDTDRYNGKIRIKQNDNLVSEANIKGGCGTIEQAHFGLYASPTLDKGTIYNEDLVIKEIPSCNGF